MSRLSIVVPTRERSDTLFHTLRTLVSQDYPSCEIIVSDNDSKDNTREVVRSFMDPRVRYINTGKRVSMAENWEFALGHVQGDFVTYIGDDDGFVPGAITQAMALIERSKVNALVWEKATYGWPDHIDENMRNQFCLTDLNKGLELADGRKKLRLVMKFQEGYTRLPCLYNGIVKKALLDEVQGISTNKVFFNAIAPDVFSGIVLSMVVGEYLIADRPFSVSGASRHSSGTASMMPGANDPHSPVAKFLSENQREYDPRIKMAPSVRTSVMGEYFLARKFLPGFHWPEPDWDRYIRALIRDIRYSFLPGEILQSAAHTARSTGSRIKIPDQAVSSLRTETPLGMSGYSFTFKAPAGMVNNIYDACQLVGGMLPDPLRSKPVGPLSKFVKRVSTCFVSELKVFYRSF